MRSPVWRHLVLAVAAAAAGVLAAPVAGASSTPAPDRFVCQYGSATDGLTWSFVANVPSGYVTGNCRDGWHLHRQVKYVNPNTGRAWDGGYFFGNYTGCGWIDAGNDVLVGGTPGTACQSPSRNPAEFASLINCLPGTCGDGAPVAVIGRCDEYANVRPWSATPAPTDFLRSRGAGYSGFLWRYVSRNGQWVMGHDIGSDVGAGRGNWVFVRRSCLGALNPRPGQSLYRP